MLTSPGADEGVRRRSKASRDKVVKVAAASLTARMAEEPDYATLFAMARLERISVIKEGVPAKALSMLARDMGVSREQLYDWVGIPRATANRKIRASVALSQDEGERVLGIARLVGQVGQIVQESGNPEGFSAARWIAAWLAQPNEALGGTRPGEFIDTGDGRAIVSGLIAQMQTGAYA